MTTKMTRITISVTARDIARGQRSKCENCPVARAISRKVISDISVSVTAKNLRLRDHSQHRRIVVRTPLPLSAVEFIDLFDSGPPRASVCKPFRFPLDLPAKLVRK